MSPPPEYVPDETIDCIDCGGLCHLVDVWGPDDEPPAPGDLLRYRCRDCLDMWYLVVPDPDDLP